MRVENEGASLDSRAVESCGEDRRRVASHRGCKSNDAARSAHLKFQVRKSSATGKRKRYRRIRKKITVPVVQAGKVEIEVKGIGDKELQVGGVF